MGIVNGLKQIWKATKNNTKNGLDHFWLREEGQKAIRDEVEKKFQPMIDRARDYESRRATNIKDLDQKLTESKDNLKNARDQWQQDYDKALTDAKNQRQTEISDYDTKLKSYNDAVSTAKQGRQSIVDQLSDLENIRDPYRTVYTDVTSGDNYVLNPITHKYVNITKLYPKLSEKDKRNLSNHIQNYETRLWDQKSNKVINVFDKSNQKIYGNGQYNEFDSYLNLRQGQNATLLRDLSNADNQLKQANSNLTAWKNQGRPTDWDDVNDSKTFKADYEKTNGSLPDEYSFNGQNYNTLQGLNRAYNKALAYEQNRLGIARKTALDAASKRDAEIAKRIQDAKDIKKAKLALGAGALAAGAAAMYGGDDTDNTDNTDSIDTTDNIDTYTGEPDPAFNVEKEGKAILKDRQQIDTGFDPDKAEAKAILAGAAYDKGVEDGNSLRASDIATADGQHIDDELFELLKAMKDPYKADAIANYIYSRHGDDPEVQRLGWRGWLNRYGDSLRSKMNIDPSGYKGMHVSGGL